MTYLLKLIFVNFWALPRPPGLKTLISISLSPTMSRPTRNIPSCTSLGRTISAMCRAVVGHFGCGQLAAGVDVAAHVAAAADAAEGGVLAFHLQRPAVHHEQPHVAFFRGRQIFLADHESVTADGVDHLVEVRNVALVGRERRWHRRSLAAASARQRPSSLANALISSRSRVIRVRGRTSSGNS